MMSKKHWLGAFIAALVFLSIPQSEARADCSDVCVECGTMQMGVGPRSGPLQVYKQCLEGPVCAYCGTGPIVIVWETSGGKPEVLKSGPEVARMVKTAPGADLKAIADRYRNRLLLNVERNVLVVQGTGCSPEALGTVVFLSPAQVKELRALGIRSLRDYQPAGAKPIQVASR